MRLEELQPNAAVRGILPDQLVTVVSVQWFGTQALELTYKGPTGRVANELLYRPDEPRLEIVEQGRPWSFDGDGRLFVKPTSMSFESIYRAGMEVGWDASERRLYEDTKRKLARQDWKYTQNYADAKTAVVEEILVRAREGVEKIRPAATTDLGKRK